jgi:alpha-tubulin suppressor-like RCC1 family protein
MLTTYSQASKILQFRKIVFGFIIALLLSLIVSPTSANAAIKYSTIGSGFLHTCALSTDGDVYCWGNNEVGQLGQGNVGDPALLPVKVPGLGKVSQLSVGATHNCALSQGKAYCWGQNGNGKLGSGSDAQSNSPILVKDLDSIAQISANRLSTCAVTTSKSVYCWGDNFAGMLGTGDTKGSLVPVNVKGLTGIKSVSAAFNHACALSDSSALYCWGDNASGQLGIQGVTSSYVATLVPNLPKVKKVSLGAGHTCVITELDKAMCWGYGEKGQVGHSENSANLAPNLVADLGSVKDIQTARFHTCALIDKNEIYCWGASEQGQLGNGKTADVNRPTKVINLSNTRILGTLSSFSAHSCVIDQSGSFSCWGSGDAGQLGNGSRNSLSAPSASSSSTSTKTSSPTSGVDLSVTIKCKKGTTVKEITGGAPKCPSGYSIVKEVKPKSVFYLDLQKGCYSYNYPVTTQVIRSGPNYKTLYPASCNGRFHIQVIFSGKIKTASSSGLATQAEASENCGLKYSAAMGQPAPSKLAPDATYLYWLFPDAGFEARKYPNKLICTLIKTDISYTYIQAQSKPLARN